VYPGYEQLQEPSTGLHVELLTHKHGNLHPAPNHPLEQSYKRRKIWKIEKKNIDESDY
jgi:hypothetical protein